MLTTSNQSIAIRVSAIAVGLIIAYKLFVAPHHDSSLYTSSISSSYTSLSYFSAPSVSSQTSSTETFLPPGPELDQLCSHYRWPVFGDRTRTRKIYHLVLVNTELDWLEILMGQMSSWVDYFVIVESPITFSNRPKPLYVHDNIRRFKKYHHKMIVHTLNTTLSDGTHLSDVDKDTWTKETFSRNAAYTQVFPLLTGDQKAWPGDIILTGDIDELVRPGVLLALKNCDFPKRTRLLTTIYYYGFQWLSEGDLGHGIWSHPDVTVFDGFKTTILPQDLRSNPADTEVWNAGWHCSFCFGTLGDIINKIQSYAHQEFNREDMVEPKTILAKVRDGQDVFGRGVLRRIDGNLDVPRFVVENSEKFGYLLDRDGEDGGFADSWVLVDTRTDEDDNN